MINTSCNSNSKNKAVEADSVYVETQNESSEPGKLTLIPESLELILPEGLKEISRKKGNAEDSLFFEVEMGINPMDLEFGILKNKDENLIIEQMEEQRLFVDDEGKTFEHESGKIYRSEWYTLTYAMEKKFRLTSFKHESDYSTLVDNEKGNIKLKENQILSFYKTRYYLRFSTSENGKSRAFVLVLNLTVGC